MKRTIKISVIILVLAVLLAALVITMTACNKNKEQNVVDEDSNGHVHDFTLVEAKSATCTEDGNLQYYTCTCGKYFDKDKNEIELSETIIAAKGHDKVMTSWESDGTSHWHKCNNCNEKFDMQVHTEGSEWIEDSVATCTAKAHHHKECSVCNYHMEEEDYGELAPHTLKDEWIEDTPASCTVKGHHHKECELCGYYMIEEDTEMLPHRWNSQNKCDMCGKDKPLYNETDGKIYFGEYPQTKETDNGITATLAQKSGDRPVSGNSGDWTDYGYYMGGNKSEYMWYIDIDHDGERYRGVYFTSYRPSYYTWDSSENDTYQDENNYTINQLYWFKWEPIEWRVLEKNE